MIKANLRLVVKIARVYEGLVDIRIKQDQSRRIYEIRPWSLCG